MSEQNSSKTTQLPLTENENLLAHQPETVETLVPAASPDLAGEQPVTCQHCGKSDFDDSTGCKDPVVFSPAVGDFICGFIPEPSTDSVPLPPM